MQGGTGKGKSTLLLFLSRQAHHYNSLNARITTSVAFVGQQHYLVKDTIRNNILFGKEFNEELYLRVIHASCLHEDILEM